MELSEVIRQRFANFCDSVVDPVSLATKLRSLTNNDRDVIQCSRYRSRLEGVMKLHNAIIGKVTWPELYTALRKENLTDLAKILHEEYYRQNPNAPPCPQDEDLNPGANQTEDEPTGYRIGSNINDRAKANIVVLETTDSNVNSRNHYTIHAQTLYLQCGDNNCMNTNPNAVHEATIAGTECGEQYDVCIESNGSTSLDENESPEDMLISISPDTVLYSRFPITPQNVIPQFSSSSSDSQDGGSPKAHCPSEADEHTSVKRVFQERNDDEMACSAPSDQISNHDSTHIVSEISNLVNFAELGITMRTEGRRYGESDEEEEEEETEIKKLSSSISM